MASKPHKEPLEVPGAEYEAMIDLCRDIVAGWVAPNVRGDVLKLRMAQAYIDLFEQYEDAVQTATMHEAERESVRAELRHTRANWTASQEALGRMKEQLETLQRQAELDAERAAVLSAAVGRARLILNDASTKTTQLIDEALASYPASKPEDEWSGYHEFRKRTDPPPYGLGLDDDPATEPQS